MRNKTLIIFRKRPTSCIVLRIQLPSFQLCRHKKRHFISERKFDDFVQDPPTIGHVVPCQWWPGTCQTWTFHYCICSVDSKDYVHVALKDGIMTAASRFDKNFRELKVVKFRNDTGVQATNFNDDSWHLMTYSREIVKVSFWTYSITHSLYSIYFSSRSRIQTRLLFMYVHSRFYFFEFFTNTVISNRYRYLLMVLSTR